ncbi:MAG: DUF5131 family protein [Myxococcota bacterium]
MGSSAIEWTWYTWNPWQWCAKVSPGCENCYAESWSPRFGDLRVEKGWQRVGPGDRAWGRNGARLFAPDSYFDKALGWNRAAKRDQLARRVFVASMSDILEVHPCAEVAQRQDEYRARLWTLIRETPWLHWLLLTKRPENFGRLPWLADANAEVPDNVWLGVSAEDQRRADERIPLLINTPAAVRFVSYEPALGPVNLLSYLTGVCDDVALDCRRVCDLIMDGGEPCRHRRGLDWVIAGAEARGRYPGRPVDLGWIRQVRDACVATETPFFLKQLFADGEKLALPELDGKRWAEVPQLCE